MRAAYLVALSLARVLSAARLQRGSSLHPDGVRAQRRRRARRRSGQGKVIFAAGDCASCHASPDSPTFAAWRRIGVGIALRYFSGSQYFHGPGRRYRLWRTVDLANALLSGVHRPDRTITFVSYSSYVRWASATSAISWPTCETLRRLPANAPHDLAFPFQIRRFVGFWKFLYLDRRPIVSDPNRGES